jgi:2-keto-3-deoxy-6-phosphogluconate aldolase
MSLKADSHSLHAALQALTAGIGALTGSEDRTTIGEVGARLLVSPRLSPSFARASAFSISPTISSIPKAAGLRQQPLPG